MRATCLTISLSSIFLPKFYMNLRPTLCVLHDLLTSYHLCFLTKIFHAFHTHTMRFKCPTNIISSMFSIKNYMQLTPTLCVLHPYLYFIIYAFCQKGYMLLRSTLCLLYTLLISYDLCFMPKRLHAFDNHTMRATCPTNIISSFLNAKFYIHLKQHYACYLP
jgi:hypothetical protein